MERDYLILTNNPLVVRCLEKWYAIAYEDVGYRDILVKARDLVYLGHTLYTHPLSGSVKPNETPYKSIMISAERGAMDNDSVMLIEDAITVATSGKFEKYRQRQSILNQRILADFQMIDFFLITSGIESAQTGLMV